LARDGVYTVKAADGVITIKGKERLTGVSVIFSPGRMSVVVREMERDFIRDQGRSRPGLRVYSAVGGGQRLSISTHALEQRGTRMEAALLMAAVQLYEDHRIAAHRDRPGWLDAPPDHFQRQGK
jgi:hypothetical protein